MQVDRIQTAISKILQVEEHIPFPSGPSIPHPIRLLKEAEQQIPSKYCLTCRQNHHDLEQHHIAGGANFPDTVTLCETCHDELSNIYQPKWICRAKNPLECYFLGWSDIFHLMLAKTGHLYFYELFKVFALNARYAK
jgi:hypothetical protein